MAFCRWFRCSVSLLVFLPMVAAASVMPDCPKAGVSSKGQFLVIIERDLERVNPYESKVTKISYQIYPREEFSDGRIAFNSPSNFWHDALQWSVVQLRPNIPSGCSEPLISDDGTLLVLLHDTYPAPNATAIWIYQQPSHLRDPGILVTAIKLGDLWPSDKFQQMLFTGGSPYWFADGSFEFSGDNRVLIYKTSGTRRFASRWPMERCAETDKSRRPPPLQPCFFIHLKNAEGIAFGVDKVPLPALARDRELRQRNNAAGVKDGLRCLVEIVHLERADKCVRPRLHRRARGRPLQQSAACVANFDVPVFDRQSRNQRKIPSEDRRVKLPRTRDVIGLNLEINTHALILS